MSSSIIRYLSYRYRTLADSAVGSSWYKDEHDHCVYSCPNAGICRRSTELVQRSTCTSAQDNPGFSIGHIAELSTLGNAKLRVVAARAQPYRVAEHRPAPRACALSCCFPPTPMRIHTPLTSYQQSNTVYAFPLITRGYCHPGPRGFRPFMAVDPPTDYAVCVHLLIGQV